LKQYEKEYKGGLYVKKKILIIILLVLILALFSYIILINKSNEEKIKKLEQERIEYIQNIKNNYSKYVITKEETNLYDSSKNIIGKINKGVKISLKDKDIIDS